MVDDLSHGPTLRAIGSVELRVREALDGGAKGGGQVRQGVDPTRERRGLDGLRRGLPAADRKSQFFELHAL